MGRIKPNKGRRDDKPGKLQWTPVQQSCDCVVDWGWHIETISP